MARSSFSQQGYQIVVLQNFVFISGKMNGYSHCQNLLWWRSSKRFQRIGDDILAGNSGTFAICKSKDINADESQGAGTWIESRLVARSVTHSLARGAIWIWNSVSKNLHFSVISSYMNLDRVRWPFLPNSHGSALDVLFSGFKQQTHKAYFTLRSQVPYTLGALPAKYTTGWRASQVNKFFEARRCQHNPIASLQMLIAYCQ